MSKNVNRRRRPSRRGVRKLVIGPAVAAAIAVPFAIGMQSAGATDGTHTQDLVFKTPAGKTIDCGLTQHVITHNKLNDVTFAESTVSGTADECKSGLTVSQSASWTDPSGNTAFSNAEGGQLGVAHIARDYAPVGEISNSSPFRLRTQIHFVNCVTNNPVGNVCDFDITTPFPK